MPLKRRKEKQIHSKVLDTAHDIADRLVEDDVLDELSRTGIVWSGILGLNQAIHPTEVAAMISSYELVKATRLLEAEPHWAEAASFAAVGAFCENADPVDDPLISSTDEEDQLPIGFLPGHTTSPKN